MRHSTIVVFLFGLTLLAFGAFPESVNGQEAPRTLIQANAPGWITVHWEHTGQDVYWFEVHRQDPPYTENSFVFLAKSVNRADSLTDKNLKADTTYKYRVCAVYASSWTCADWVSVRTLSPPPPSSGGSSGGAPPPSARKPAPAPPPKIIGSNDFNDDGHGDILWHNASTGESQIWFMSGSSRIGRATILDGARPTFIGPPWSIVGSRDFNEDGKTDLLWHNSSSGETQIWHMNGHKVSDRATVLGENGSAAFVGLPWSIVGTNTMNGYGNRKPDIIWHNSSSGETQIWNMDDHRVRGRATVLGENGSPAFVGLPWSIVGTNDFNHDGTADILWHNSSTGETQIWNVNRDGNGGYRVSSRATVLGENGSAALVGLPWSIVGTNDFNQDGKGDILWYNSSTGETQIWFMNGRSVVRRATVDADLDGGGALVGPPWSIMNH